MWELVQVTGQYSHAVLVAILPFISDFAHRLDLQAGPVTTNQVLEFKCDPRRGQAGGAVTLTNGFQFTFLDGRVTVYRCPQSYYSLQYPEEIPKFYGPVKLTEKQALKIALVAIKNLGYEKSVFNANKPPLVTQPERVGRNWIPRYRFRWPDPNWPGGKGAGTMIPALMDMEINGSNGRIEMVIISSRDTRRPSPKVDVVPPLLHPKVPQKNSSGTDTATVNDTYAKAFLEAILPQTSDFIIKTGLKLPTPVTINQLVMTNYICRMLNNQPIAQLYLTNGDRFNYRDGYVSAYYAHDAFMKFPDIGRTEDFLGHVNITTNEAITLCERIIRRLGYNGKLSSPNIVYAATRGPLAFTRYNYNWQHPGDDSPFASFEVDMESKAIKVVYLKDSSFQKPPPKIDVPMGVEVFTNKEHQLLMPPKPPLAPTLPPGMPLPGH